MEFTKEIERRFAGIISYLTHPLIIPMLGLLVISNSGTYAADLDQRYNNFIYLSVFIFTLLLPVGLIPLFYFFGLSKNVQFTDRKERIIPMYITLAFYIAVFFLIKKMPISVIYEKFLLAGCLSMASLLIISYFWKISAHMIGWGGLTGLILFISLRFDTNLVVFFIVALFISGIVGFSRLKLETHTPAQIYLGFLTGFLVMLLAFII
jgi:membrane-associated phospholipid phosphatase